MRFRSEVTSSGQVFAVVGTNTVSFGIVAAAAARQGLLGYAVARRDVGADQWRVMDGFKVFDSVVPVPTQDLRVSTSDHPVQSFFWDDFAAEPDHVYEYEFQPVKGQPGALEYPGRAMTLIAVRTEPLSARARRVLQPRSGQQPGLHPQSSEHADRRAARRRRAQALPGSAATSTTRC